MHYSNKITVLLFLAASACTTAPAPKSFITKTPDRAAPTTAVSAPAAEVALVQNHLANLQRASFSQNVEFCGFVGTNQAGRLVVSDPVRGSEASCLPEHPRNIQRITASYHTHGGFSRDYLGELPSPNDVLGDREMGVNGYVSTPGGRLWFIDSRAGQLSQICGFGCLPNDPRFQRGGDGPIAQSYSFSGLSRRHGN